MLRVVAIFNTVIWFWIDYRHVCTLYHAAYIPRLNSTWRNGWRYVRVFHNTLISHMVTPCVLVYDFAWFSIIMTSSNGIFFALLAFVRGSHRWPVDSPHKGQWRGALMFSLMRAWTKGLANNTNASYLRRHRSHYDVTVMTSANLF